jgi:hypothetical protein
MNPSIHLLDGNKNVTARVTGIVYTDQEPIELLDVSSLKGNPQGLRFDSVLFALQEKMGVLLWWGKGEDLILPLESRGNFRFDSPINSPRRDSGWDGKIWYSVINTNGLGKHFMFLVDFDKQ